MSARPANLHGNQPCREFLSVLAATLEQAIPGAGWGDAGSLDRWRAHPPRATVARNDRLRRRESRDRDRVWIRDRHAPALRADRWYDAACLSPRVFSWKAVDRRAPFLTEITPFPDTTCMSSCEWRR